jgi:hypothetical protein
MMTKAKSHCCLFVGVMLLVTTPAIARAPVTGQWGGAQANLVLDTNGGQLDLGCSAGTIEAPVIPRKNRRFTARGHFMPHRGGAQPPEGMEQPNVEAVYTGRINGQLMNLWVKMKGQTVAQYFVLERGKVVRIAYCM